MNNLAILDQLLHQYVDPAGRVDYRSWITHDPHTRNRQEHLAHWINLYNILTIQEVLSAYPIASIRPTLFGLPNWIGFLLFFQRRVHGLGSQLFNLAEIENRMLRQHTGDPRILFAIVCASPGCPLLRPQAYIPEPVDLQLDEVVDRFINNAEIVRFNPQRGACSTEAGSSSGTARISSPLPPSPSWCRCCLHRQPAPPAALDQGVAAWPGCTPGRRLR